MLTFPYNQKRYIDNVYEHKVAGYGQDVPYICQVFSRKEIDTWMKEDPGNIIEQEYYKIFSGDFWTFGDRVFPPCKVRAEDRCHLTCLIIQKT